MDVPETRYVTSPDGVYIAYQVAGEGPVDVAWQFDFVGNVDLVLDDTILWTLVSWDRVLRAVDTP